MQIKRKTNCFHANQTQDKLFSCKSNARQTVFMQTKRKTNCFHANQTQDKLFSCKPNARQIAPTQTKRKTNPKVAGTSRVPVAVVSAIAWRTLQNGTISASHRRCQGRAAQGQHAKRAPPWVNVPSQMTTLKAWGRTAAETALLFF
jgi:hypothetical protein